MLCAFFVGMLNFTNLSLSNSNLLDFFVILLYNLKMDFKFRYERQIYELRNKTE